MQLLPMFATRKWKQDNNYQILKQNHSEEGTGGFQ